MILNQRYRGDAGGSRGRLAVSAGLAIACLAGAALALPLADDEIRPFLVIERAALSDFMVDDLDAGLARAISMIPARLHELPDEIPGFPIEALPAIDLGLELLSMPGRLGITYNPGNTAGGLFGYGIAMTVDTRTLADADAMHETILDLLELAEMPMQIKDSEQFEGRSTIQLPFATVTFGPRGRGNDAHYDLMFGSVDDPDQGFASLPAPAFRGFEPILRGHLDFSALTPVIDQGRAMMGDGLPIVETVLNELTQAGLVGDDAITIDFQSGYTADESVTIVRINGARQYAEALGLPTEPLTADDLRVVPSDAVMASIAKMNLGTLIDSLDKMEEYGIPIADGLAQFEEMTGVDLREDVLGAIGGTVAFYLSDSTGGGGLLSSVMLLEIDNRARFASAHNKLVDFLHESLDETPVGDYIRLQAWESGGTELMSLRFQGIPVPLELSYALTERWLIIGATPQAVLAAAQQARGDGDGGLVTSAAFREVFQTDHSVSSISFLDNARLGRSGYPLVSLIGSALANGVRSPHSDREPGMVVPTYHELMDGARATVEFGYWDGDDFVDETHADRSVLVQMAGVGGAVMTFAPLVAAVAVPAMMASSRGFSMNDAIEDTLRAARMVPDVLFLDPAERALLTTLVLPQFGAAIEFRLNTNE